VTSTGLAMSWGEWQKHDAIALADLVRTKQVTTTELSAQAAEAVPRVDPGVDAVLGIYEDVLADPGKDGPNKAGRLYGVPMFLKDIGPGLAGRIQESGSKLFRNHVVKSTDPLVDNYLRAGLVPIGRSTTPEFGMTSFDTSTNYLGRIKVTRNPWKADRTPGGSSGGSAAVVAAGIVPISMASDSGGSTRIPAACCGLIGLKATRGRVPRPLAQNEYMNRTGSDGVLSRTVRDTAAAYDYLTRVPNGGSFIKMGEPSGSYLDAVEREPGHLTIGLSTGMWGRATPPDPEITEQIRAVARLLEGIGHRIDEIADEKICNWPVLWWAYYVGWLGSRVQFALTAKTRGFDPERIEDYLSPMVYRHYLASERHDKFDVWKAMACNNTITREFGRLMERFDLLLVPTTAIRVPEANGLYSLLREEEFDPWRDRLCDASRYTIPANETGLPSISIPVGLDREGIPIGAQLYGNFCREDVLLQLAAQIERARPEWFGAVPPISVI
jgi:amidase